MSTSINQKVKIMVAGRVIGEVSDGIFKKNIKGSTGMLRTPRAICLSVESLQQAERMGAHDIAITDMESGLVYHSTVTHFKRFAFELNRIGEKQRGLCLDRWTATGGNPSGNHPMRINPAETITPAPVYEEAEPAQLSLFV